MAGPRSKKKLIQLHPYKYIDYDYFAMELNHLHKEPNIEVEIHDLSNFLYSKEFNGVWPTKGFKKAIKFRSLFSWLSYFIKLDKKNTAIYNFVPCDNLKTFIIQLVVRLSKIPIIIYSVIDVAELPVKKNIKTLFRKIKFYKFNFKLYYYTFNSIFFSKLIKLFKIEKLFIMCLKKNIKNNFSNLRYVLINRKNFNPNNILAVESHSEDFSKSLIKFNGNKKKEKYIIYLDTPTPYLDGDQQTIGKKYKKDLQIVKKWYKQFNDFFDDLELFYKAKLLVIPHPKTKGIVNPYFKNRVINHQIDAAVKFIPQCKLLVTTGSTGISHAISHYKPFTLIYSPLWSFLYKDNWRYKIEMFYKAKLFKKTPIDITSYNKKEISKNFKINRKLYDLYKYKYLTAKNNPNKDMPNYKIIKNIINNYV